MKQPSKPTLYFQGHVFHNLELVDEGKDSFVYQADTDLGRIYTETMPFPEMPELAAALLNTYREEMDDYAGE